MLRLDSTLRGFPFNAVNPSNWPFNCHNQREAIRRQINADDLHKRTIDPLPSRPLHFYIFIIYSRGNRSPRRFRNFEFYGNKRRGKGRERETLTRHELDSTGEYGRENGMDKRNLDLGWIIERNWTPFDRFLRNQSDKLMDILGWLGGKRSFSKNIEKSTCIKGQMEIVVLTMLRDWNSGLGIFLVIDSSLSKAFSAFVSMARLRVNWEEIYRSKYFFSSTSSRFIDL